MVFFHTDHLSPFLRLQTRHACPPLIAFPDQSFPTTAKSRDADHLGSFRSSCAGPWSDPCWLLATLLSRAFSAPLEVPLLPLALQHQQITLTISNFISGFLFSLTITFFLIQQVFIVCLCMTSPMPGNGT